MIDAFITNKKEYFRKTIESEHLTNAVNFAALDNEKSIFVRFAKTLSSVKHYWEQFQKILTKTTV